MNELVVNCSFVFSVAAHSKVKVCNIRLEHERGLATNAIMERLPTYIFNRVGFVGCIWATERRK